MIDSAALQAAQRWRDATPGASRNAALSDLARALQNDTLNSARTRLAQAAAKTDNLDETALNHLHEAFAALSPRERDALTQTTTHTPGAEPVWLDTTTIKDLPPPEFVIPPWVPRRAVTIVAGKPDLGKTGIACTMAVAVATGRLDILGLEGSIEPGKVGLITLEDDNRTIEPRIAATLKRHDIAEQSASGRIACLYSGGEEAIMGLCPHVDIIIADPLVYLIDQDESENDNAAMAALIGRLRDAAAEHDLGIVICAHESKAGKDGEREGYEAVRGASAIVGSARSVLRVRNNTSKAERAGVDPEDAKDTLRIEHVKSNWARKEPDRYFRRSSCPWRDSPKPEVLVVEPWQMPAEPDMAARARADIEAVMSAIEAAPPENRRHAERAKEGWIGRLIARELGIEHLHGPAKQRVKNAIDLAVEEGRLVEDSWTDRQRRQRKVLRAA